MEKISYMIFISLFSFNVISCGEKDESSSTPPTLCELQGGDEEYCISSSTNLSAPSSLTANSAAGQVTLDWNTVSGANSYTVYWDNDPDVNYSSTAITSVSKNYYIHSGLDNGTTYFYKVAGVNSAGTGTLSIEANGSTPLPAPNNLSAINRIQPDCTELG